MTSYDQMYYESVVRDLLAQKEAILFKQLDNLVRDGVLKIVQTEPVIVQDPLSNSLKLEQAVKLTFDAESVIIEQREKIKRLLGDLEKIRDVVE